MKKIILLMIVIVLALISCDSEEENEINPKNIREINIDYLYKEDPEKAELLLKTGYAKAEGNRKKEEKYLKKLGEKNSKYYTDVANMYEGKKGIKKHEEAYKKGSIISATFLGIAYEMEGKKEEAESWYKKGLQKGNYFGYKLYGMFLYNQGRIEEAEKYLIEAANLKNAPSMYTLTQIYYEKKDKEKMEYWINKLLTTKKIIEYDDEIKDGIKYLKSKDVVDIKFFELYKKAEKHLEKKEYDQAEKYFIEMEKLKKEEGELYLADFYYRFKKEEEKGIEKYKEAYLNGNKKAAIYLAIIEHRDGNIERAKKWYEIASNEGDTMSQMYLAEIYSAEGKKEEAYSYYVKAAEGKDYEGIRKVLDKNYELKNYDEIRKWSDIVKNSVELKNYFYKYEETTKLYERLLQENGK